MNKICGVSFVWLLILALLLNLQSCTAQKNQENENADLNYTSQSFFEESSDGWYYYFIIEKVKNGDSTYCEFNAMNLKYREIPNYVINGYDEEGNVAETMLPIPVSLYNGPDTKKDIKKIAEYFNTHYIDSVITVDSLKDLNIETISKETVVEYFNNALNSPQEQLGKYKNMPICNVVQENENYDGYRWQIGYILNYGNIKCLNIELIYDNGEYLSDKESEEAKSISRIIDDIEDSIVDNQDFCIDVSTFDTEKGIDWQRLAKLLNSL